MSNQLDFPFPFDAEDLHTFLARMSAIEDEFDWLREEQRLLADEYADALPLRAVRTALKVVRARHKLAAHAKEPLALEHQTMVEERVTHYVNAQQAAKEQTAGGVTLAAG